MAAYRRIKLQTIKDLDGTPATGIDEKRWLKRFAEARIEAINPKRALASRRFLKALHNVERGLRAAGGEMKEVVSLRIYIADYSAEKARPVREALQHFFPPESAPASTWIGVPCLAAEEFLIEIEAMAVIEPS